MAKLFHIHFGQQKRVAVDAGAEMVAREQRGQNGVDSILWPAIGRGIEILPNIQAGLAQAHVRDDRRSHRMVLWVAGKSDLLQCVGRPLFCLFIDLRPFRGITIVKLRVKPVEHLFGGVLNAFVEGNERLFLAPG